MTPQLLEHVRAEALFVSYLQSSDHLDPHSIREAVMLSVRRHGPRGCAALVAQEFGEHPDTAVGRMGWVLDCIRRAYDRALV
ncbi:MULTISPECIES: hypothetical protein [Dactylosporangium]|uniref:Uncharacterized protein n=2 Tax=Dactylosporangium TaxID=35753 RepID=A0A9W6NRP7_9ACTN|nr:MULTISPECIES: hypothetical protein [Dactylosporangium]UAB95440.1 hypothetical protein Dvina_46740 [Dactylosporangium vinaceum]UWZ43760.1 hypothetical protein Dmats_41085 [Dactylosporangium matsuzakiense]GLL06809.1 hypothetical protein GCM10017581_085590 [Dactylosporangium matsuzakiense]